MLCIEIIIEQRILAVSDAGERSGLHHLLIPERLIGTGAMQVAAVALEQLVTENDLRTLDKLLVSTSEGY